MEKEFAFLTRTLQGLLVSVFRDGNGNFLTEAGQSVYRDGDNYVVYSPQGTTRLYRVYT